MNKLLSRYFELNFFLIPIRKNSKLPLFKKWNRYSLSYNEAKQYLKQGYNLAVVAKDLLILDYDTRPDLEQSEFTQFYRSLATLVQLSPRGFHVFLRKSQLPLTRLNIYLENHAVRLHKTDTIRTGDMYVLVAPSKIDGHSYWWLDDMKGEILTL